MAIMVSTSVLPTHNVATGGASLSGRKMLLVFIAIVLTSLLSAAAYVQPATRALAAVAATAATVTNEAGKMMAGTFSTSVAWLSASWGAATSLAAKMSPAPSYYWHALTAAALAVLLVVVVVVWAVLVKVASKECKKEGLIPLTVLKPGLLSTSQPKGTLPRKASGHDASGDWSIGVAPCTETTVPAACSVHIVCSNPLFEFEAEEKVAAPYNPHYDSMGFSSDSEDESDDVKQPYAALTAAAVTSLNATPTSVPLRRSSSLGSNAPSSSGTEASTLSRTLSPCSSELSLDVDIAASFPTDQSPRAGPAFAPKSPAAAAPLPVVEATTPALSAVVAEPPSQARAAAAATQEPSAVAPQALTSVSSSVLSAAHTQAAPSGRSSSVSRIPSAPAAVRTQAAPSSSSSSASRIPSVPAAARPLSPQAIPLSNSSQPSRPNYMKPTQSSLAQTFASLKEEAAMRRGRPLREHMENTPADMRRSSSSRRGL